MTEPQSPASQTEALSERERSLEQKVGGRTILLVIVSMVALIELLLLTRPLLK